jgi:hypothetical protein
MFIWVNDLCRWFTQREAVAVAQDGAHGADLALGTKAAAQEAHGVEVLQPLAVLHVGLAPREVFAVARVDEHHLKPGGFEDLVERDPVNASGLHGDGGDAALDEPIAQGEQVLGEGGEGADGVGAGAGRHGHINFPGAHVDAGGVGMERGRGRMGGGSGFSRIAFVARGHSIPLLSVQHEWRASRPAASNEASEQTPERDERDANEQTRARRPHQ